MGEIVQVNKMPPNFTEIYANSKIECWDIVEVNNIVVWPLVKSVSFEPPSPRNAYILNFVPPCLHSYINNIFFMFVRNDSISIFIDWLDLTYSNPSLSAMLSSGDDFRLQRPVHIHRSLHRWTTCLWWSDHIEFHQSRSRFVPSKTFSHWKSWCQSGCADTDISRCRWQVYLLHLLFFHKKVWDASHAVRQYWMCCLLQNHG